MQFSQVKHFPHALGNVAAGVEYAPAKFGNLAAYAVVEDERSQAAAEESEVGHAVGAQLRYPRPDVLPYLKDKFRKDQRVGGREDGCCGLVRHNVIARPEQPPYGEAHLWDRSAVRADEDDGGYSAGGSPEFLRLEQPVLRRHRRILLCWPGLSRAQASLRPW